jgi:hypothetical protein
MHDNHNDFYLIKTEMIIMNFYFWFVSSLIDLARHGDWERIGGGRKIDEWY